MTILEVINDLDFNKPNQYSMAQKIKWLSNIDRDIYEVMKRHEGELQEFNGYSEEIPMDIELLVKAPYDKLYGYYLEAQVDYYNQEMSRYNNSIAMFNNAYEEWINYYSRMHKAISTQEVRF